jgi:recombinational DNA repair protein RecT
MAIVPAKQQNVGGKLSSWIQAPEIRQRIVAAVSPIMPPDQFIAHALVSFQDPIIRQCTLESQLGAFMQLSAFGLLPILGQAALIPYGIDTKTGKWRTEQPPTVSAMPQWQGYKAIMERHPAIQEVEPFLVHVCDDFKILDGMPVHTWDPFDPNRTIRAFDENESPEHSNLRGGYVKIVYRDGRPKKYHFTPIAYIHKCWRCARQKHIWSAWPEEMALKTVMRHAYARRAVPVDPLVASRLEHLTAEEDALLENDPVRAVFPAEISLPKLTKAEEMAAALDATTKSPQEPGIDQTPPEYTVDQRPATEQAAALIQEWQSCLAALNSVVDAMKFQIASLPKAPKELHDALKNLCKARCTEIRSIRGEKSNGNSGQGR